MAVGEKKLKSSFFPFISSNTRYVINDCPNHSKSCPRKMCTMLTKLGRQMMKKVANLLCIVLEFFESGGRFRMCGMVEGFGYYEMGFCFAFAFLSYYTIIFQKSRRVKMHFSQNGNFARDFSQDFHIIFSFKCLCKS